MKIRKYILQEYDNHPIPGWRNIDGTVRLSRPEAETVLKMFREGEGYSSHGTGEFRIEEYKEEE
jgi:hypothetical protein